MQHLSRTRWAAIGAAVAISLGAGGLGLVHADIGSGARPVTVTVSPERVLDTRVNLGLTGALVDDTPRELVVVGNVAVAPTGTKTVVPTDATGVVVNVTVVGPTSAGFLSLRPGGATGEPTSSNVNFTAAGGVYPNAAVVALGAGGTVQIWLHTAADGGNADVLIDIVGYTVGHNHDDRYYTKTQSDAAYYTKAQVDAAVLASTNQTITQSISGSGFGSELGDSIIRGLGCSANGTDTTELWASVQAPIGYRVTAVRGTLYDTHAGGNGLLTLGRVSAVSGGVIAQMSTSGSGGAQVIDAVVTPAPALVSGDLLYVWFRPSINSLQSQICGIEVTFSRP